ncbi:MAG: M14 family metallopeptidase, partial [Gemmatimonadota bacterium]
MPNVPTHARLVRRIAAGCLVLFASTLVLPASARGQATSYLDYDGLTRELRALTDGSELARLGSAGTSIEGREIWIAEVGDPSGAPLDERPAVLVVGHATGSHLVGSALALEMIRHLVRGSAGDSSLQATLEERTVYVLPRLDPDAAEARFAAVLWDRTRNARPVDDDNDGRTDEDGPEDLNGDGMITVMRAPDPSGAYRLDPDEPRLMKEADPAKGEAGAFTLYREGTDSDGDGFLNEDGPGGVDLDRNFQHEYPYYEADAGPHMVSEPETRALMDFALAHRNIGAILTFGPTDNLVTPPDSRGSLADPAILDLAAFADASNAGVYDVGVFERDGGGSGFGFFFGGGGLRFRGAQPGRDNDPDAGRRPATTVNEDDLRYYETVSEAYREITGIERVAIHRTPRGAFFQYGYFQFGVPSFSTPGWGLPEAEGEDADEEAGEEEGAAPPGAEAERGGRAREGGGARRGPGGG